MRDFGRILRDARAALGPVDVYPTDTDRRLSAMPPRVADMPWPWWAWFLFGAAAMLGGLGVALIVADAIATGAATAVQAQEYASW
jgi:hypothetical protein